MSNIAGVHHIALTVSDLERSAEWYINIFDLTTLATFEEADGERRKIILCHRQTGLRIGLVTHRSSSESAFDETRVGLDHLSLAVADRSELERFEQRFEQLNVTHSPIVMGLGGSYVLVFRDPDNIQLELVANAPPSAAS